MYPSIELFHLSIPTFFAVICFDVVLCLIFISYRLDQWLYKQYWLKNDFPQKIWAVAAVSLIFGLIGARLTHVFYEMPSYYMEDPVQIFYGWNGGYTFFGGLIFGIFGGWLTLALMKDQQKALYFDFFAPVLSLGYLVGRLGCLLNGCCYGKFCELPWAIKFLDDQGSFLPRHPTQLYAMLSEALIFLLLILIEQKESSYLKAPKQIRESLLGSVFLLWLMMHSISRFALEFYRDDFRGPEYFLSISSWISLCLFSIAAFLLYQKTKSKHSSSVKSKIF